VFVGDLSFVNPACTGFTTSASEFGLNVGVVLGAIVLLSVLCGLRLWWSASSTRRYLSYAGQSSAAHEVTQFARYKLLESWVFCLTSIVAFSFEILFVRAINAVHCVQRDGLLRLSVELDQVSVVTVILAYRTPIHFSICSASCRNASVAIILLYSLLPASCLSFWASSTRLWDCTVHASCITKNLLPCLPK